MGAACVGVDARAGCSQDKWPISRCQFAPPPIFHPCCRAQAFAGIVTVSVGHCHPDVVQAVNKQSTLLQHTTTIYLNNQVAEYAKELADRMPGNLKVRCGGLLLPQSGAAGTLLLPPHHHHPGGRAVGMGCGPTTRSIKLATAVCMLRRQPGQRSRGGGALGVRGRMGGRTTARW